MKIIRAQLTSAELILLRYNVRTEEGSNFQENINKYNVLKHLPVFDLLELKKWRKDYWKEDDRYQINHFFSTLTKQIDATLVNKESKNVDMRECQFGINKKSSKEIRVTFFRYRNLPLFPSKMDEGKVKNLLKDLLQEIFIYSSFERINKSDNIAIEVEIKSDEATCTIKSKTGNLYRRKHQIKKTIHDYVNYICDKVQKNSIKDFICYPKNE